MGIAVYAASFFLVGLHFMAITTAGTAIWGLGRFGLELWLWRRNRTHPARLAAAAVLLLVPGAMALLTYGLFRAVMASVWC